MADNNYRGDRPPRQARPRPSSQSPPPALPPERWLPRERLLHQHRARGPPRTCRLATPAATGPPAEPAAAAAAPRRLRVGVPACGDPESADYERVMRKKSLVRPDREKIEPGHRQWHYRSTVANLEEEGPGRAMGVMPSSGFFFVPLHLLKPNSHRQLPQREALRRAPPLAREEDVHESGLSLFTRGAPSAASGHLPPPRSTPPQTPPSARAEAAWATMSLG
ncbi:hypothetical protein B0H14DRAFT_3623512, partial [Mycena olivaceomarginata]